MVRRTRLATDFVRFAVIAGAAGILVNGLAAQGPRSQSGHDLVRGREAAAGEVLVKFRADQSSAERTQVDAILDADRDEDGPVRRLRTIHSRRFDASTLVAFFQGAPDVEYAEPNYILYAIQTPNDPSFPSLWGLLNSGQIVGGVAGTPGADIDAAAAWSVTTGSTANVVGVIDTGVDYNHPDLAANIWSGWL